jgi:hypothetical protein
VENRLKIRLILCWFLVGITTLSTVTFLVLSVLKALGHPVSGSFLLWFGGTTVAVIVPLLKVFVRAVWQQAGRSPRKPV